MASILQQIGTPLQLIALFLLLLAGVARILARSGAWKPSPGIQRLVIDRLFQASVAALLFGLLIPALAPVLDRWLSGDAIYRGAVLSDSGDPVADATVNLISVATTQTNALGHFDVTVARSRVLPDYRIQVKATGYETSPVLTRSAEQLKSLEIRLKPAAADLVRSLQSPLLVAQFFGVPVVIVTLHVVNDGNAPVWIKDIRGALTHGDSSLALSPLSWTIAQPSGPYMAMNGWLPILAKSTIDLHVAMTTGANFGALSSQLGQLPEYRSHAPCTPKRDGATDPLSAEAFRIVRTFANEHFTWRPGAWRLTLDVATDNEAKNFQRDFVLSDGDVERLKASVALLGKCLGTNTAAPLAQDGGLANFLSK